MEANNRRKKKSYYAWTINPIIGIGARESKRERESKKNSRHNSMCMFYGKHTEWSHTTLIVRSFDLVAFRCTFHCLLFSRVRVQIYKRVANNSWHIMIAIGFIERASMPQMWNKWPIIITLSHFLIEIYSCTSYATTDKHSPTRHSIQIDTEI